jgi:NADPH:quinone reductase-like Zn-dependent oxidoreductase
MRAAGITTIGGPVENVELPDPGEPAADEVLVEVRASGVANWDDFVRTGRWDVGSVPPMALGVAASGTVAAVGAEVSEWQIGDEVLTHPLPLRGSGTWAPLLLAPADQLAAKPAAVSWEAAAVFPVPALTALQVVDEALELKSGETVLVHGAGGVTGRLLVLIAAERGAEVIATAGPTSAERVKQLGAAQVLDYHDEGWPEQVRVSAAVNAAGGGAVDTLRAVADGGRFATITSDAPPEERGIRMTTLYVRPDGPQLRELAPLLEQERFRPAVVATYGLDEAEAALDAVVGGRTGGAVALVL